MQYLSTVVKQECSMENRPGAFFLRGNIRQLAQKKRELKTSDFTSAAFLLSDLRDRMGLQPRNMHSFSRTPQSQCSHTTGEDLPGKSACSSFISVAKQKTRTLLQPFRVSSALRMSCAEICVFIPRSKRPGSVVSLVVVFIGASWCCRSHTVEMIQQIYFHVF